ncbi:MAG: hypothetical protein ACKO8O_12225 [Betaproteobacteria bacterium]
MLSPDRFFGEYSDDFPPQNRNEARKLFRRAIREYYVMHRRFVIDPESGKRVKRVFVGAVIQQQKRQRRTVKSYFTGRRQAGRPERPEIKLLVARLFILWGRYARKPATFSWKGGFGKQTRFEAFMFHLLPLLGAPDVRRYVEAHWRDREVLINAVLAGYPEK